MLIIIINSSGGGSSSSDDNNIIDSKVLNPLEMEGFKFFEIGRKLIPQGIRFHPLKMLTKCKTVELDA